MCYEEPLINDPQQVHQIYHGSEHPCALVETDIVRQTYAGLFRPEYRSRLCVDVIRGGVASPDPGLKIAGQEVIL